MAPATKGNGKGREVRPSRSRNTTPSSSFSAGPTASVPAPSYYLDSDLSKLLIPSSQYAEILERMGGVGPIPDSKSLESLVEELKNLAQMADTRGDVCNAGIRELSQKRKDVPEEPEPMDHDAGERTRMKREVDDDEDLPIKGGKLKKRKERGGSTKEERPLNHGAHEVARQDGAETKIEGGEFTLCLHLYPLCYPLLIILSWILFMCILPSNFALLCIQNANLLQRLLQPRRDLKMPLQRAPLFLLLHERPLTTP